MKVLGVSGSPIQNSNTDRAMKAVLEATGIEYEFIKLIDYNVSPCNACLGCVETNICTIKDDGILLAEKAKEAGALIIGGFTPYSTIDSRTKAFIERLYPLRHNNGYMHGKPGAAVVTACIPSNSDHLPPSCELGINAIRYYMMEEGMNFVGAVKVQGNVPCVKCGYGDECEMSGVKMIYGEERTVESVGINDFEMQAIAIVSAEILGRKIADAMKAAQAS